MDERIKKVMAGVFGIEASTIDEDSSPDSIENWDSLRHIRLIAALEDEFRVQFDESDLADLLNFKIIKNVVETETKRSPSNS